MKAAMWAQPRLSFGLLARANAYQYADSGGLEIAEVDGAGGLSPEPRRRGILWLISANTAHRRPAPGTQRKPSPCARLR